MLQIVHYLLSMPVVYRPHPLYWHNIILMQLRMLKLSAGKGHQVIKHAALVQSMEGAEYVLR